MESILIAVRDFLDWAPNNLVGGLVLALAAAIALLIHSIVWRVVRRFFSHRHPYLASILLATTGPARAAFLLVALFVALPVAPFVSELSVALLTAFLVMAALLLGWIALTAIHVAADLYLRRFRIDTEDNLLARKHVTQVRVLLRVVDTIIVIITIGAALMSFESVRQYGVSLFASAGVAGLVIGLAARPVLGNLIAGIQLAITQPIRIDDAVVVEGEFGRVEDITSTYVVLRLWDLRRMIVPLTYFIEKPFQNWTRESTRLIGTVLLYLDYTTPVERVREKAVEIAKASSFWDGDLVKVQVIDTDATAMHVRVLASARSAGDLSDLRNEIREKLIDFLRREMPDALPRTRQIGIASDGSPPDRPSIE